MKKITLSSIVILNLLSAQAHSHARQQCGTASMPQEQVMDIKRAVENWLLIEDRDDPEPVHVLIAWHVIHTSTGAGNITDDAIYTCIEWLNETFLPHFISFTVDSIDRTENDDWFNNWYGNDAWPGMQALNVDPYHYLNIYSANLYADGVAGWSYLGNGFGASDYRQSVNLDFREVQWGNDTNTHEVGHHMGLPHTFNNTCSQDSDGIDDTPRHHEDYLWSCNENLDSCPDDEGNDPVHNYMTYTSSASQYEFTEGQEDWMKMCNRKLSSWIS
jgi:Predicted Zn-dependent proteases